MTLTRRAALIGLGRVAVAGIIWGTIPLVLRAADGASIIKVFYRVLFAHVAILRCLSRTPRAGGFPAPCLG